MVIHREANIGFRAREYLLAEGEGKILGVFRESFYCRVEGKGVLLFHKRKYGTIPFGVGCRDLENLIASLELAPGMRFRCGGMGMAIPSAFASLVLKPEDAVPAKAGSAKLLSLPAARENAAIAETMLINRKGPLLGTIRDILGASQRNFGARPRRVRDVWKLAPLDILLRGLRTQDESLVEKALDGIIGLGFGLTPTMDDVLVGLSYTIGFFKRHFGIKDRSADILLELILGKGCGRTTDISGAYMRSAALGEEFSILEEAELSLTVSSDAGRLSGGVESLLAVGGDSGGNMLAGILLGVPLLLDSMEAGG